MNRIYLDNNSTTPIDPLVLEEMLPYFKTHFANPSSLHSDGKMARIALLKARERVSNFINASPNEIIFTSGGTETNNLAIKGMAISKKNHGTHLITSKIEHPSVLETFKYLEKNGFFVSYIGTDNNGVVNLKELEKNITSKTILISIMTANNEVGTIQPIKEISEISKKYNICFHTDAVQAAGKIKINVNDLGVDLLTISSHKINGPKGVGALFLKKGVLVTPLFHGGHQEKQKRPGTENITGIIGFGKACELIEERINKYTNIKELREYFEKRVSEEIKNITINAKKADRIPNTSNICFHFTEGESIMLSLDLKGISVSTGSACASGSLEPSYVLSAMGVPIEHAQGAVRFSLGHDNTKEQIDEVILALVEVIERIRALSPLYEDQLESFERGVENGL